MVVIYVFSTRPAVWIANKLWQTKRIDMATREVFSVLYCFPVRCVLHNFCGGRGIDTFNWYLRLWVNAAWVEDKQPDGNL
jgi:hypothetical protein